MNLILKLAFRNLVRQRRRNILLGIAISFGMMILVIANSFSHGISDTLINRVIVIMTGHIDVALVEAGNVRAPFMREKARFEEIIRKNVTGVKQIIENVGLLCRVIGNGKSDNCWLAGIGEGDLKGFSDQFRALEGDIALLFDTKMVNPCVLSKSKADFLNVKTNDILRIRMQNIHGQQQTGVLTVAAIVESANMFTDFAFFLSLKNVKMLRGLRPWETGSLQVILEEPHTAIEQADRLHGLLKPGLAYIPGALFLSANRAGETEKKRPCLAVGFLRDRLSKERIAKEISIPEGQIAASLSEKGVMISERLRQELNAAPGDTITLTYKNRYEAGNTTRDFTITGVFTAGPGVLPENGILLSDHLFYKTYYAHLPEIDPSQERAIEKEISGSILSALTQEWALLKRSRDFNEMKKKFKDFICEKNRVAALDIRTMHETASNIIKLERVLNLITFIAVIILFFIILIGVVNTLRMTIKERTREIGTVRAIGMRRSDVRNLIITETFLLSFLSTIAGTIMAFAVMEALEMWEIHASSFMNILLVEHRLYFLPNALGILLNMGLILLITAITAYFPSRRAARRSVAGALGHFE